MIDIISVCYGFDKDWQPVQDTIGQESSIFYRTSTGKMVTRTGVLIDIIETSSKKYLGIVAPIGDYTILGDPLPENNNISWKGFLTKQNDIVHEYKCNCKEFNDYCYPERVSK